MDNFTQENKTKIIDIIANNIVNDHFFNKVMSEFHIEENKVYKNSFELYEQLFKYDDFKLGYNLLLSIYPTLTTFQYFEIVISELIHHIKKRPSKLRAAFIDYFSKISPSTSNRFGINLYKLNAMKKVKLEKFEYEYNGIKAKEEDFLLVQKLMDERNMPISHKVLYMDTLRFVLLNRELQKVK